MISNTVAANRTAAPPGIDHSPPHPWEAVSPEKWADWRWQLSHSLTSVEDFAHLISLTSDEAEGLAAPSHFRVAVTPYFASLMDPADPTCPIRRQIVPTRQEGVPFEAEMADSLGEDAHSPVPGLIHRYPDRVLMLVTTQCASYCRFCTRSRIVGDARRAFDTADLERQLVYIAAMPKVRDVLLSGGDPLMLPQLILERLLSRLRDIPHVEVIRIGTRVPVFLPQRITAGLIEMLSRYHPLWMNLHINHPKEFTRDLVTALARLANAGIPLGSQTVLMAGVNDCPNIMLDLFHTLVRHRVRPYYLYQCDLVHGAGHFRTSVAKGLEIMESLRGHTSGFAIPTYVIDALAGGGKVPILPNYLLSMADQRVVVRNYEGFITAYTQPGDYRGHDPSACTYCQARRTKPDECGVAGLLSGAAHKIVPEGWDAGHRHPAYGAHSTDPQAVTSLLTERIRV